MNWLNDFYFLKITTHIFTKWPEASLPWTSLRSLCSWQLFKFNKEHSKTIQIWNVWYNYKLIIIIIYYYYYIDNIIGKFLVLSIMRELLRWSFFSRGGNQRKIPSTIWILSSFRIFNLIFSGKIYTTDIIIIIWISWTQKFLRWCKKKVDLKNSLCNSK